MRLDMRKVRRALESVVFPVQLLHPTIDIRISSSDGVVVAFEVTDVDGIEADNGYP